MYDDSTRNVIDLAFKVSALSNDDIGKILTEAHAKLASARLSGTLFNSSTHPRVRDLSRLADTLESIAIASNIDVQQRRSCAFVSASCRTLLCQQFEPPETPSIALNRGGVSGEIRGCLLFLISGQIPDALELINRLPRSNEGSLESVLLNCVSSVVTGDFRGLQKIDIPDLGEGDLLELASYELMRQLIKAAKLFGDIGLSTRNHSIEDVIAMLTKVKEASNYSMDSGDFRISFSYPGIFHLSSLMRFAFESLYRQLVVKIGAPSDLQERIWARFVKFRAIRRPYVWPNHQEAISSGYLEKGKSAVVTFPTGAGKTTVIDLKIGASVLRGERVLVFVPTLALEDQTYEHLKSQFPGRVSKYVQQSEGMFEAEASKIFVLTPEKYLASTSLVEGHEEIGLAVFDEFHLIHPTKGDGLRRNLDAMMSIIDVMRNNLSTDFLLVSAMVSNGDEISSWLTSNGKSSINLDGKWKPTRQIRGCVVYDSETIYELEKKIHSRKIDAKNERGEEAKPKASDKKSLVSRPHALFCLTQAWHSHDDGDYTLLPISQNSVPLALNKWWYLTPNKNEVSAILARNLALSGTKTVVFTADYVSANSIAKSSAKTGDREISIESEIESELLEFAIDDVGDPANVFRPYGGFSCQHHSSMLDSERRLSEEIFKRRDGSMILVATSTLSQGLNLPAEAVILVGDMRYDTQGQAYSEMAAHELLNAAGRAGRAGFSAHGLVLIVPSDVATFERKVDSLTLHPKWFDLQKRVFSNSDQCLKVDDPIQTILDMMHTDVDRDEKLIAYFLHRIPAFDDEIANEVFTMSLSGFRARNKLSSEFSTKVKNAIELSREISKRSDDSWVKKISEDSGVSIDFIEALRSEIRDSAFLSTDVLSWVIWFFGFCKRHSDSILVELRQKPIVDIWGHLLLSKPRDFTHLKGIFPSIIPQIETALCNWMTGKTLTEIEQGIGKGSRIFCPKARKIVGTIAYDFSYLLGVVVQTFKAMKDVGEISLEIPLTLVAAPNCLREGLDAPELLAMRILADKPYSRKVLRSIWSRNMSSIGESNLNLEFGALIKKIRLLKIF